MSEIERPAHEANVDALVSYFQSGIEPASSKIGIELEHIIVRKDGSPVSYQEDNGVAFILSELSEHYPIVTRSGDDILGVSREHEAITIEPAAQIELSAGPFSSLSDAQHCFTSFEQLLKETLEPLGAKALTRGYHPTAKALDLELIPKQRYQFMNEHLGAIGPYGPRMMRGTASTQISIDYSSTQDCLRKLRLAFALVPALSLMTDNAPVFEGAKSPHPLMRTEVWKYCDPARCGIVPGIMNADFTLEDYAEYILRTPAILVPEKDGNWKRETRTFDDIYAQEPMARADVEHAVSMFFTDVRLKTYVEIRPADAMPAPYALAYAALIKGLLIPEHSLNALDELFANVTEEDIVAAKESLMERGYEGNAYSKPIATLCDELIAIAMKGLCPEERSFLNPLATLVEKRTTLGEQACA